MKDMLSGTCDVCIKSSTLEATKTNLMFNFNLVNCCMCCVQ